MKKSQERLAETEKVALTQTTPMTVMEQEMTAAIERGALTQTTLMAGMEQETAAIERGALTQMTPMAGTLERRVLTQEVMTAKTAEMKTSVEVGRAHLRQKDHKVHPQSPQKVKGHNHHHSRHQSLRRKR